MRLILQVATTTSSFSVSNWPVHQLEKIKKYTLFFKSLFDIVYSAAVIRVVSEGEALRDDPGTDETDKLHLVNFSIFC